MALFQAVKTASKVGICPVRSLGHATMKTLVHPGIHVWVQHGVLCVRLYVHGFYIQLHWVDDIPIFAGIATVSWMFISSQLHLLCGIASCLSIRIPILLIHVAWDSGMICVTCPCGGLCRGCWWIASIGQCVVLFILHQHRE